VVTENLGQLFYYVVPKLLKRLLRNIDFVPNYIINAWSPTVARNRFCVVTENLGQLSFMQTAKTFIMEHRLRAKVQPNYIINAWSPTVSHSALLWLCS
jgi:hypothetical protein